MKKTINVFASTLIPLLSSFIFAFFLKEEQYEEIATAVFSIYSVLFATLVANKFIVAIKKL